MRWQCAWKDDGVGFAPDQSGRNGLGLRNIAERVRMLGGALKVRSAPGQGTRIEVQIPIPENKSAHG